MLRGLYTDLLTDTLYAADDAAVLPLFKGAVRAANWRSQVWVTDGQPSYAWARIGGAPGSHILRLRSEQGLTTLPIDSNRPIRLPAIRSREWDAEVESSSRFVSLVFASSSEELR